MRVHKQYIVTLFVAILLLIQIAPAFAQTATHTPVPTATIGLYVNTNVLLTGINTWTNSLDDVVFLGVAISIAVAILTFIGAQILKAFRGGGG